MTKLSNLHEAALLSDERDMLGEVIARMESGEAISFALPTMSDSQYAAFFMFAPEFQIGAREAAIETAKGRVKAIQSRLKKLGVEIDRAPLIKLPLNEAEAAE